jgi:sugar lactone lactonase YvrE
MDTRHIERVGALRCAVGESPLWSVRDNAWYWVDITARTLWRLDAAGALRSWNAADEMVGCIALRRDGLIAGMETGVFALGPTATRPNRPACWPRPTAWTPACASTTAAATARAASGPARW